MLLDRGAVAGEGRRRLGLTPLLLWWALCFSASFGCRLSEKGCTEIGCFDHFGAVVSMATSDLPEGLHHVQVTADGTTSVCMFAFTREALSKDGRVAVQCAGGLMVDVRPATVCTPFETGGAKGLKCDPVPGQIEEIITVPGTPSSVQVVQSVDGVVILEQGVTPTYASQQPNGPGCDPICHSAGASWTIPSP
jgi:hypothetical protein